jgi:hypothetical protein
MYLTRRRGEAACPRVPAAGPSGGICRGLMGNNGVVETPGQVAVPTSRLTAPWTIIRRLT